MAKKLLISVLLIFVVLFGCFAYRDSESGTHIYVSSSGLDSNSGTSTTTPVKTLSKALSKLSTSGWNYVHVMSDVETDQFYNTTAKKVEIFSDSETEVYTVKPLSNITYSGELKTTYFTCFLLRFGGAWEVKTSNIIFDGNYGDKYYPLCVLMDGTTQNGGKLTLGNKTTVKNFHYPADYAEACIGIVDVWQGCTLTMEDGSVLTKNEINAVGKSSLPYNNNSVLVAVGGSSVFYMNGGEITENKATAEYTGMVGLGTKLSAYIKGKVYNNELHTSNSYALTKRMETATLPLGSEYYFAGDAYVYNNKDTNGNQKNVFTPYGATLKLNGKLSDNAHVGVYLNASTSQTNQKLAEGSNYTPVLSDSFHITSDLNTTAGVVFCDGSKDYFRNDEITTGHTHEANTIWLSTLAKHIHNWVYGTKDGNTLIAYCTSGLSIDCEYWGQSNAVATKLIVPATYLKASFNPDDSSSELVWSSSVPSVAKVDPETGLIQGVSAGSSTITATALDGGGISKSVQVTVK